MANIPDINFNKIPNKSAKFNQAEFYEENFEKVNEQIVPKINEMDTKINVEIPAQLADIEQKVDSDKSEFIQHKLDYAEYLESELGEEHIIRSLPNGTKDEIRVSGGKVEKVKRIEKVQLNSLSGYTEQSNVRRNVVNTIGLTLLASNKTNITSMIINNTTGEYLQLTESANFDNVENIGKYYISGSNVMYYISALGTVPTINHTLTYQLATPILITLPEQMTPNTIEIARLSELTNKLTNAIIALGGTII